MTNPDVRDTRLTGDLAGRPPLVIWHKGCLDGFTSAWVVWKYYQQFNVTPDFHEGVYQTPPPDCADRDVIMVDFSYPEPVIDRMSGDARSVLVIDHHKTAEKALSRWQVPWAMRPVRSPSLPPGRSVALFDMNHAGCSMCWRYYFPDAPQPRLVYHVQDRDLWRFELPGTEEICAVLYAEEFDFARWDALAAGLEDTGQWDDVFVTGRTLLVAKAKERRQLATIARKMTIGGWPMPVVNAPWFHASELGNELAQAAASRCAATYHDDENGMRKFSLRSVAGGPDVSEIAAKMGGGGHPRAAGFTAPKNWEGDGS